MRCGSSPASSRRARSTSATTRAASASTRRRRSSGEAFFCIVDLHSITVEYDPADLRERTLDLAALLFATGLDPERSTVFAQSHVTAHAEAAWLLSAVTSYGQLGRMTQFKDKGERQEFVTAGLFTYPILMAGDILLYQTDFVPIGDDQRQHLELARDIAERFNTRFGETFKVPDGDLPRDRRADHGPAGADEEDVDDRRHAAGDAADARPAGRDPQEGARRAVTDSGTEVRRGDDKPGVTNLIDIMTVATGESAEAIEARYDGGGYGQFKGDVAEAVVALLEPIQERYHELRGDPPSSTRLLARRAPTRRARPPRPRSRAMYERMGFVPRV